MPSTRPAPTASKAPRPASCPRSIFWGLGFGIEKTAEGESLWHWGDNGVFKAFFVVRPATKSGVVYLTNSENGLSIGRQILTETLGGEQPAFDWLKYDNYDSPALSFTRVALEKGAAAALEQFSKELASGAIPEGTMNQAGYSLMGSKNGRCDSGVPEKC